MKHIFIVFASLFLIPVLVTGQSMQSTIDNLIKHKIITEEHKQDVELILKRKESLSPDAVMSALMYVEMIKMVGRENMEAGLSKLSPYSKMLLTNPTEQQKDSINRDMTDFLEKVGSAGLVTVDKQSQFKAKIDKNMYPAKLILIDDISQDNSIFSNLASLPQPKKSHVTNQQITDAISHWKKIGILNHLTEKQISSAKKKALSSENENLNDVLLNFPKVAYWLDLELENLTNPYTEILKELSTISHGAFNPTDISDNFRNPVNNKVSVQFSLNNKNYSTTLRFDDDWADTDFFTFIDRAVAENKLPGQFYELYEGGQGAILIFLSLKQYRYLKDNKLVVFIEH